MKNFDDEKWVRCRICNQRVQLHTGEQSTASNLLEVHQRPCLAVYFAARSFVQEEGKPASCISFGEASEELMESATMTYMFEKDNNLWYPYYTWMMALYIHLMENATLRKELDSKYDAMPRTPVD